MKKTYKVVSLILALTLVLCGMVTPAFAEEAASKISIMDYQDFSTDYDASEWYANGDSVKLKNQNDRLEFTHASATGFLAVDYPEAFTTALANGTNTTMVVSATMGISTDSTGGSVLMGFGCPNPANAAYYTQGTTNLAMIAGGSNVLKFFDADVKTLAAGEMVDVAFVISFPDGGRTGTAVGYLNGEKVAEKEDFCLDRADGSRTSSYLRMTVTAATGYYDNFEAYAVTNGDLELTLTGVEDVNGTALDSGDTTIGTEDAIVLEFDNPVIKSSAAENITINGEAVGAGRISLSDDLRTVTVAAPSDGYSAGAELEVAVSDALKGYASTALATTATVKVAAAEDPVIGKVSIMDYQDFSTDYDTGKWFENENKLDNQNGVLKWTGSNRFNAVTLPKKLMTALNAGQETYLVIRTDIGMKTEAGAQDVRMGLGKMNQSANYSSNVVNMVQLVATADNVNTLNINGQAYTGEVNFAEMQNVAVVVYFPEGGMTGTATYYLNGTKVLEDQATDITNAEYIRLFVNAGTGSYDNFEAFAVTAEDLALTLTGVKDADGKEITAESTIAANGTIVLEFDNPIIASSMAEAVTINGTAVEADRLKLSDDLRTITIAAPFDGYSAGTDLAVAVSDALKGYASTAVAASATVKVAEAATVVAGEKIVIADYQDFGSSYSSSNVNWTRDKLALDSEKGILYGAATTPPMFNAIGYSEDFTKMLASTNEGYMIIRTSLSMDTDGTAQDVRMGLGKANPDNASYSSNVVNMVQLLSKDGVNTLNLNGQAYGGTVDYAEMADVAVVVHFPNGGKTGTATYYLNGAKVLEDQATNLADSEYIRFYVNSGTGYYDNIEAYAYSGGTAKFEYSTAAGANGSDITALPTDEGIVLTFTSDMVKENLVNSGVSAFAVNGEAVPAERISVTADGNGVVIAPPAGGWNSQTEYSVAVAAWASDILGTVVTPLSSDVNFKTGGAMLTASVTSASIANSTATAAIAMRNADASAAKKAMVIIAEFSGTGDNATMVKANVSYVDLTTETKTETITLEGTTEGNVVRVFVWEEDTLAPIMTESYTI